MYNIYTFSYKTGNLEEAPVPKACFRQNTYCWLFVLKCRQSFKQKSSFYVIVPHGFIRTRQDAYRNSLLVWYLAPRVENNIITIGKLLLWAEKLSWRSCLIHISSHVLAYLNHFIGCSFIHRHNQHELKLKIWERELLWCCYCGWARFYSHQLEFFFFLEMIFTVF